MLLCVIILALDVFFTKHLFCYRYDPYIHPRARTHANTHAHARLHTPSDSLICLFLVDESVCDYAWLHAEVRRGNYQIVNEGSRDELTVDNCNSLTEAIQSLPYSDNADPQKSSAVIIKVAPIVVSLSMATLAYVLDSE